MNFSSPWTQGNVLQSLGHFIGEHPGTVLAEMHGVVAVLAKVGFRGEFLPFDDHDRMFAIRVLFYRIAYRLPKFVECMAGSLR